MGGHVRKVHRPAAVVLAIIFQIIFLIATVFPAHAGEKKPPFSKKVVNQEQDPHERIKKSAGQLIQTIDQGKDETEALKAMEESLAAAEEESRKTDARFGEIEEKLKAAGLSNALAKHQAVVKEYEKKNKEFRTLTDELRKAKDKRHREHIKARSQDLLDYIEKNKPKKEYHIKSNDNLPWHVIEPGEIKLLGDASSIPGMTTAVTSTAPPTADDLSPTIDVQITPEIQDLAKSLDNNPLKIYRYVYNNYRYTPYYGSLKGSLDTYWEKEGNDYDLASLLIALLRASNIPARYTKAQVIVSIDRVKKWVNMNDPMAALQYLSSAQIPFGYYSSGGGIGSIQMEHVYVEAYVPYANYRGSGEDASGKIWIPLDPSLKEEQVVQAGVDIATEMGFDWKKFSDDYFSNFKNQTPMEFYTTKINDYIIQNHPGQTMDTLKRITQIKTMNFDFLPNTLPYSVTAVLGHFAAIPQELRHTLEIKTSTIDFPITLPEIAGRRITLTFAAATPDDQAVIDKFGSIFKTPPYLIQVTPSLKVNGNTLATGGPINPGSDMGLDVAYTQPGGKTESFDHHVTAGSYNAIGITIGKVRPEMASISTVEASSEPYLSKMVHSLVMKYHDRESQTRQILKDTMKMQSRAFFSEALVSTNQNLQRSPWGFATGFDLSGYLIDAKDLAAAIVPIDGGADTQRINFGMVSGYEASFQENRTFEDSMYWVSGLSAIKAIPLLKSMGVSIQELVPGQTFWNPNLPDMVVSDVNNALNKGWNVMVPMETGGLPVVPYIKYDPTTGSAGYMIATTAGGFSFFATPIGHELDLSPILHTIETLSTYAVRLTPEIFSPVSIYQVAVGNAFPMGFRMTAEIGPPENVLARSVVESTVWIDTNPNDYTPGHWPDWAFQAGTYTFKFDGSDLFTFNVWGVEIDPSAAGAYMGISTEYGVDSIPVPLNVPYSITDLPNINLSEVVLKVTDSAGQVIRSQALPTAVGNQTTTWDGKDDSGQFVIPGVYKLVIQATGAGGKASSKERSVAVFKIVVTTPCMSITDPTYRCSGSFIAKRDRTGDIITAKVFAGSGFAFVPGFNGFNWTYSSASPGMDSGDIVLETGTTNTGDTVIFHADPDPDLGLQGRSGPLSYKIMATINGAKSTTIITQDNLDELRQEYEDLSRMDVVTGIYGAPDRIAFDKDPPVFTGLLGPNAEPNRFQWHILSHLNGLASNTDARYNSNSAGGHVGFVSGYRTPMGNLWLGSLAAPNSNHQYGRAFDFNQGTGRSEENYDVYTAAVEAGAAGDTYLRGSDDCSYYLNGNGCGIPTWPAPDGVTYTRGHVAW